jgi:hypothetical protein
MRDDIHKNAPVNRDWKNVIKCTSRDADYKTAARKAAKKAIGRDLERELSSQFMSTIENEFWPPQRDLEPIPERVEKFCLENELTPTQNEMVSTVAALADRGVSGRELKKRAAKEAIKQRAQRMLSEIRGHAAKEAPSDCRELMRRLEPAVSAADLGSMVARHLEDPRSGKDWEADLGLDLDADLRELGKSDE